MNLNFLLTLSGPNGPGDKTVKMSTEGLIKSVFFSLNLTFCELRARSFLPVVQGSNLVGFRPEIQQRRNIKASYILNDLCLYLGHFTFTS